MLVGILSSSCCGDVPPMDTSYTEMFMKQQCGNGTIEEWEECDDGEANSDNGPCSNECIRVGCGDGLLDEGEECDFGDANVADDYGGGCSTACVVLPECGDGNVDAIGDEECDDGNTNENDDCLNTCEAARCGDGKIQIGVEECDDGNQVDNDDCTNGCKNPGCGNGVVEGDEECDDGNQNDTDECLSTCIKATCGDAKIQPVLGEECDDGNQNEDDGCTSSCGRDRVVFVTSAIYQGGDFGSLDGADTECRFLAEAAGLDNFETFRAWLSDRTGSPATRFFQSKGRYILLQNERVVAYGWEDLTDGEIWTTIDVDENGDVINQARVWSNTAIDGTQIPGEDDCVGWSMVGVDTMGRQGSFSATDSNWTDADTFNPGFCSNNVHLYCFEQSAE